MKKLFVSVPMKGRTEEEIKESIQKMKKIAEIYEGEELELIGNLINGSISEKDNEYALYLGERIKNMAQADVFIGISESWTWLNCYTECSIALKCGIKTYSVSAAGVIDNYAEYVKKESEKFIVFSPELEPCSCSTERYL